MESFQIGSLLICILYGNGGSEEGQRLLQMAPRSLCGLRDLWISDGKTATFLTVGAA